MSTSTTITVHNTGHAPVRVAIQGQLPQRSKRFFEYSNPRPIGTITPRGLFSLGAGLVQFDKRYELIANEPTTIEITGRDGELIAEALTLIQYADTPPAWEVDHTLNAPRIGERYELTAKSRLSFRIEPKASTVDDVYLNFRNLGDASVRVVETTEIERWHVVQPARWTDRGDATAIAPGTSQKFRLSDSARIYMETDSTKDLTLEFSNSNLQHTLRLIAVEDGVERIVANLGHAQGAAVGTSWAPGLNLVSGQVTLRKSRPAVVQQSPL